VGLHVLWGVGALMMVLGMVMAEAVEVVAVGGGLVLAVEAVRVHAHAEGMG